jgi:O-methyltransferase involved in polyketide biosynthesis
VTTYIHADLREPEQILKAAAATLDLSQPVGLILSGVLGHIADTDEAKSIVTRLLDALSSGSYLSINDGTKVVGGPAFEKAQDDYNDSGAVPYNLRTPEEIAGFFAGLELVEPGVVSCPRWRPDPDSAHAADVDAFGGVGRKP